MGFYLINHRVLITLIIFLVSLASLAKLSRGQTRIGFYVGKCIGGKGEINDVEKIVHDAIEKHFKTDPTIAPKLLRMHFHDCFVNGCDGSILLDGPNAEKTAVPNLSLASAFPAIEEAKTALEAKCPGVVSCADILALAARDSVLLTKGFVWAVPTGRRDGNVSLDTDTNNLPAPSDDVPTQIQKFSDKGLNVKDLVTLVGAHTIGFTDCQFFSNRLSNYNNTGKPDPSMDPNLVQELTKKCTSGSVRVALDSGSETKFDNLYFKKINAHQGVLESDQRLLSNATTNGVLQKYVGIRGIFGLVFKTEFGASMVKMSNVGALTGTDGEIRKFVVAMSGRRSGVRYPAISCYRLPHRSKNVLAILTLALCLCHDPKCNARFPTSYENAVKFLLGYLGCLL
ncbi:cationic peroxidase 2 [Phtheirospermum japonicum]|uniref:Peroxidase n=1 Tax=Phtheirospermum japonicum TaxID=374723 RepID=A0A830CS34_9LAMI|nr:cationic peroxidase 2 [Phtheirospermum japonicum]